MIVCNSSPIIYLSKLGKLSFLRKKFKKVVISEGVYQEVIGVGKKLGKIEVESIEKGIENGWIEVKSVGNKERLKEIVSVSSRLHGGEVESIVLSEDLSPSFLVLDDSFARRTGESLGLKVKGTLFVLLKSLKNGLITKKETIKYLNDLVGVGFRISIELYTQVLEEINSFQREEYS